MKIAFIGTGLMGMPMAEKLAEAGFNLNVYNRTISKTDELRKLGLNVSTSVSDAVEDCNTIISMLSDYHAFEETILKTGRELSGKYVIQMSTISPKQSWELKKKVENLKGHYLEAPVLGSIPQIRNSSLIVMIGGSKKHSEKFENVFKAFSNKIIYVGETGKASALKLALNQLIASMTAAFSMSYGYIREAGVDTEIFMDILRSSALYSPTFDKKLEKINSRNFDNPNFPVKHLLKDVNLIIEEFSSKKIAADPLEGVKKIIEDTVRKNMAELDYSAIYNSIHKE